MCHGQTLINRNALNLVKYGGVGGIKFISPIHPTRRHHVDRKLPGEQRPNLNRRGVGAQQDVAIHRLDEKSILQSPRRVILIKVQGIKVEPFMLKLRAFGDLPAHRDEYIGHIFHQHGQGVASTAGSSGPHRGEVQAFLAQASRLFEGFKLALPGRKSTAHLSFGLTHHLSRSSFGF